MPPLDGWIDPTYRVVGVVVVHPVGDANAQEGSHAESESVVGNPCRMHASVPDVMANKGQLSAKEDRCYMHAME